MKQILAISFLFAAFATPALAAEKFSCSAPLKTSSLEKSVFTQMELSIVDGKVVGKIMTDLGWMDVGFDDSNEEVNAEVEAGNFIALQHAGGLDYQEIRFELKAGTNTAQFEEFIDCVGDFAHTTTVTCTPIQ